MPLEDDFSDIVKKARMGLGRSVETVAQSSGVKIDHLLTLERGSRTPTTDETHAIAKTLGLRSAALAGHRLRQVDAPVSAASNDGLRRDDSWKHRRVRGEGIYRA